MQSYGNNDMTMTRKSLLKSASVGAIALMLGLGGYQVARSNVFADDNVIATAELSDEQKEEQQKIVERQVIGLSVGVDVFSLIDKAFDAGEPVSQQLLDEWTYQMVEYAQLPQFVAADGELVRTAESGFIQLLALYDMSNVDPSFELTEDGRLVMLRDIKAPESYDVNVEVASEVAADIVNDDVKVVESVASDVVERNE